MGDFKMLDAKIVLTCPESQPVALKHGRD